MSTLKTGALRGTSGTADSVQLHASNQSVTFPGAVSISGALTSSTTGIGKILQVLTTATETATSTQSTSYVDATGMSLSITPSSTSSKIIIVCCGTANVIGQAYWGYYTILRGSTDLGNPSNGKGLLGLYSNDVNADTHAPMTVFYIDSPNTTSSTTYKLQLKVSNSSGYAKFNQQPQKATFTLLEVGP